VGRKVGLSELGWLSPQQPDSDFTPTRFELLPCLYFGPFARETGLFSSVIVLRAVEHMHVSGFADGGGVLVPSVVECTGFLGGGQ